MVGQGSSSSRLNRFLNSASFYSGFSISIIGITLGVAGDVVSIFEDICHSEFSVVTGSYWFVVFVVYALY